MTFWELALGISLGLGGSILIIILGVMLGVILLLIGLVLLGKFVSWAQLNNESGQKQKLDELYGRTTEKDREAFIQQFPPAQQAYIRKQMKNDDQ